MTKPTYSELEAENLRVRGLLQRLEWSRDGYCPDCLIYKGGGRHMPDCELGILLFEER
jgi:hypothetical protein